MASGRQAGGFFNPGPLLPASFGEGAGPPEFLSLPFRSVPLSRTPAGSPSGTAARPGDAAFQRKETCRRPNHYLQVSGLDGAARFLAPPGFVPSGCPGARRGRYRPAGGL